MILSSSNGYTVGKKCLCQLLTDDVDGNKTPFDDSDSTANNTNNNTNTFLVRCPVCVQRMLQPYQGRHEQAWIQHALAKDECTSQLAQRMDRLSDYQCTSQQLRDRIMKLRQACHTMTVRVASLAVENDDAHVGADPAMDIHRSHMARLQTSLLHGAMTQAIVTSTNHVRMLRFQWARKAIGMHRIDVDPQDAKQTPLREGRQRRARGIGKIGGLPLPHAGPELYGVLPPRELQSALRLVASVTSTVARCLGIILPHPILLTPTGPLGDITDTVLDHEVEGREVEANKNQQQQEQQQQQQQQQSIPQQQAQQPIGSSSTSSLLSLMDGSWTQSAKNVFKRATGHPTIVASAKNTFIPPSTDATLVAQRLHHATAAILAEDASPGSSKFALSAEVMRQQDFAIALQLLQNNIIVLCIRAGVPVAKLWPAEALLLNIHALDVYCEEQTAVPY